MAELSSSKKIPANNNAFGNNSNAKDKNIESRNISKQHLYTENQSPKDFQYKDVFNYTNPTVNRFKENPLQNSLLKATAQTIQNNRLTTLNYIISASGASQQKLIESINIVQTDIQNFITNFLSRFVNIMDKISAVYGEKEKDARERLSDTFKRLEIKLHELLGPVDASLEQKEHSKEKLIKNREKKSRDQHTVTHRVD